MELDQELHQRFGHTGFRPGQREIVEILLAGRSALAVFPTGGGKSLCYQLPALLLDGLTLVISPLIALMRDQVEALRAKGIDADRLDSSQRATAVQDIYERMASGRLRLLYVAPERLGNEGFLARLRGVRIALLAIDEAHCISSWGHNFRPDYLKLGQWAREFRPERVLALTATATPEVSADIRQHFLIRDEDHIQTGFFRPNLRFRVTPCDAADRDRLLLERLQTAPAGPAIVYVTLQETAERLAGKLTAAGWQARAYHAGLAEDWRSEVQDRFMSGELPIVVATIAFGMGIDKADIRAVFHYNLPKSLESYIQESGRAGRDGGEALCEILACASDRITLENFAYGDTPSPRAIRALSEHLLLQGERFSVSRYDLSGTNDIRPLVVATALTQLELEGVLLPEGPFYSTYRVRLQRPLAKILTGFEPSRRALLERLFAAGRQGRTWITIELAEVAQALGAAEEEIRGILVELELLGDVVLEATGLRHGYRLGNGPFKAGVISDRLNRLFEEREAGEIARIDQVIAYCESDGCLAGYLVEFFGDRMEAPCGLCSGCLGTGEGLKLPALPEEALTPADLEQIRSLMGEKHAALRQPRQMARFLCGMSSPASTRARLTRHDAFGSLSHLPFPEVLAQLDTMLA
jgi:ATP-dependent DNA helicase RecQ